MNGGKENFVVITSLQYTNTYRMNMMGRAMDFSSQVFIETGKLYRKQMAAMFGMKPMYTLLTDTAGFVFTPGIPSYGEFQGMEGGLKKMDDETYKLAKNKLNATADFAELIDCNSKGYTAELLGKESVDKVSCFKIKLIDNRGLSKLFWIDESTYLVKQLELQGKQIIDFFGMYGGPMYEMMNKNARKQKSLVMVNEYTTLEGIKIPTKFKAQFGNNDIEIENTDIKINTPIDSRWYGTSK
jgi:hypothetical protein